ncbi:hypothetical protein ACJ5NV_07915 [Loktanella agnita]|uniref:hypothetical protein n=1 Tax=Loktanella agnita TaxID=287097 RepID=UPI003985DEF6
MKQKYTLMGLAALSLSACSGGSDTPDVVTVPATTMSGFVAGDTTSELLVNLDGADEPRT